MNAVTESMEEIGTVGGLAAPGETRREIKTMIPAQSTKPEIIALHDGKGAEKEIR